jgi:molecular chaperone DnaK (HSP70)
LGTTDSCVGVWQNDRVEIIPNDMNNLTTPSCVAFTDTEIFIGEAAKFQMANNPHNTIFGAERLIGRSFNDQDVQSDMKVCYKLPVLLHEFRSDVIFQYFFVSIGLSKLLLKMEDYISKSNIKVKRKILHPKKFYPWY